MKRLIRLASIVGVVLFVLLLAAAAGVLIPWSGLEAPRTDPEQVRLFEQRTADHFALIEAGSNLDLPFPEMVVREGNDEVALGGERWAARVELGRLLYFDPLLSGEDDVSCAHCHHPDLGLSDNRGRSMGKGGEGLGNDREGGALLRRGSPTVWNAAYNHLQFWDGRARDLEEQATKPIQDPNEMAEDPERLVEQLRAIPEYVERFGAAFAADGGDGQEAVTFENTSFAIAAFERTLVSDDSRYDRYARGERTALSETERVGLNVFRSLKTRCFECHNLPLFNNPDFKVVGVPDTEGLEKPDLGRAEIAGGAAYERAFKVPTLRNVALTAPYMHNGAFATLDEVVDFYAGGGGMGQGMDLPNLDDKIRAFQLSAGEKRALIAFLHTLTDTSRRPEIPETVPSGLTPVVTLANQSREMEVFVPVEEPEREVVVRRDVEDPTVLLVGPGERIQDAIDLAVAGDTVLVEPGVYHESLTLDVSGITLRGRVSTAGETATERAVLDGQGILSDGAIGSGSDLVIEGFEVRNYTANGLMINLGKNVTFRNLKLVDTGLYGVYPVQVIGVLVEDVEVIGTRDAGIYVGQSRDIVVRDSVAHGNVTGIEIENSIDAVVENNHVYDNTGGILVFGLPNNPSKVARGCRVIGNRVIENNRANFGDPSAVVSKVPAGTGILVLAGDDVEISGNEILGNDSFAIGVAGLDTLLGAGSTYDMDPYSDRVLVHGNTYQNNGTAPDALLTEAGFQGGDLLWDLDGAGNRWDEPGTVERMPAFLPTSDWSEARRARNQRLWRLLSRIAS